MDVEVRRNTQTGEYSVIVRGYELYDISFRNKEAADKYARDFIRDVETIQDMEGEEAAEEAIMGRIFEGNENDSAEDEDDLVLAEDDEWDEEYNVQLSTPPYESFFPYINDEDEQMSDFVVYPYERQT